MGLKYKPSSQTLGPYGGPREVGVFCERVTLVGPGRERLLNALPPLRDALLRPPQRHFAASLLNKSRVLKQVVLCQKSLLPHFKGVIMLVLELEFL